MNCPDCETMIKNGTRHIPYSRLRSDGTWYVADDCPCIEVSSTESQEGMSE